MAHLLSQCEMDTLVRYTHQWNVQISTSSIVATRCKWVSGSKLLGYVAPHLLTHLKECPDVFGFNEKENSIEFTSSMQALSSARKTVVLNALNKDLNGKGVIPGWRNELFPVVTRFGEEPELLIERAACAPYGIKAYGCHVNGFLRDEHSQEVSHLWVGRRSAHKSTYPGMLDHIVAGGLPHGVSVTNNVIKECSEEASIPEALAATARSVGALTNSYIDHEDNYKRDVNFCFDLELPPAFVPVALDGEVESFRLLTVREVLDLVLQGGPSGFKPNCNLVLIDFFIRYECATMRCIAQGQMYLSYGLCVSHSVLVLLFGGIWNITQ